MFHSTGSRKRSRILDSFTQFMVLKLLQLLIKVINVEREIRGRYWPLGFYILHILFITFLL